MNIISNYRKDTQTEKPNPGSYEWWYFDAQSADGYKIVVIFYDGNPFSRRYNQALKIGKKQQAVQYPALSISVYQGGEALYYSFCEVEPSDAEFSAQMPYGKVKNCRFSGGHNQSCLEYNLDLDQRLASGDSIQAHLSFQCHIRSFTDFTDNEPVNLVHEWNMVMPVSEVEGEILINGYRRSNILFKGLGYHDHNVGFEPLKNEFNEWYWGRYHMKNYTFVYYLVNRKGSVENNAWLIDREGIVTTCGPVILSNYGYSFFGLKAARVMECSLDGMEIFLQLNEILDSGPFYQRFGGGVLLKTGNDIEAAKGISEYLKPPRIHEKKFLPLINMRVSYPGKTHWVQKSPRLYRWTW